MNGQQEAPSPRELELMQKLDLWHADAHDCTQRLHDARQELERLQPPPPDTTGLTPTQKRVLPLLLDGYSNKQIAFKLGVVPESASRNVSNILKRTGDYDRIALIIRYYRSHISSLVRENARLRQEIATLTGAAQTQRQLDAWPGKEHPD